MTQIKICGIRQVEHALAAAEAGADMLGFVFASSRRRVEPETAHRIVETVRARFPRVRMVGLFVDERAAEMERIAAVCDLDLLQLSGDEPDARVASHPKPVIRTVHVFPEMSRADVRRRIDAAPGEIVLVDTGVPGSRGGTGVAFDWSVVPEVERPVMLAGGLTPSNVGRAIQMARPWGVDVSSGVERDGVKDISLIREFVLTASKVYAV